MFCPMRPTMSRLDTAPANGGSNRLHHRPGKSGITAFHPTSRFGAVIVNGGFVDANGRGRPRGNHLARSVAAPLRAGTGPLFLMVRSQLDLLGNAESVVNLDAARTDRAFERC